MNAEGDYRDEDRAESRFFQFYNPIIVIDFSGFKTKNLFLFRASFFANEFCNYAVGEFSYDLNDDLDASRFSTKSSVGELCCKWRRLELIGSLSLGFNSSMKSAEKAGTIIYTDRFLVKPPLIGLMITSPARCWRKT